MHRALDILGWIACVIYSTIPAFWLVIHPWAQYWRSRRRSPYRVLLPLWISTWAVVALITAPWRDLALYRAYWTWLPAICLFVTGIWLYRASSVSFSADQLGGFPELIQGYREQRLVTAGIRSRVRHPLYLAHLCEMLAWSLGTGLLVCYGLMLFAIATGAVMIRSEDAELEQRFGAEYVAYRTEVPALLPRVRGRTTG